MKLSIKKRVFVFLMSCIVVVVIYFVWNAIMFEGKNILTKIADYAEMINAQILTASIGNRVQEVIPAAQTQNISEAEGFSADSSEKTDEAVVGEVSVPESLQDQLDDIQEKLDVIRQQIMEIRVQQESELNDENDEDENQDESKKQEKSEDNNADVQNIIYPQITISNVQASPIDSRFIELYNPNNFQVDLTGWYLQRKTKTSNTFESLVSSTKFEGKIILPNSNFLISKYSGNILSDLTLTGENTLVLKNPNREIASTYITPADTLSVDVGGGGVSGGVDLYPKILISEVRINPTNQRFVELYNPNSQQISLSGWYLQRKDSNDTSFGSCISHSNFDGKIIPANGYFLISRELDNSDIIASFTLSQDNSLALKNPDGGISDKLGFGDALDFELQATVSPGDGQSIGRRVLEEGVEQDTDNNSTDFVLNTPTPKFQNIEWSEPAMPTLMSIEVTTTPSKLDYLVGESLDISGLEITGHYSDGSIQVEPIAESDISGFDSLVAITGQTLTITFSGKTANYIVNIYEPLVPTLPSIVSYTIINPIISTSSPSTSIDLEFSESVDYKICIGGCDSPVKKWIGTATNPHAKTWDGKDSSGAQLPDGIYVIEVTITDPDKNSFTSTSETITIDNSSLSR